MQCIHCESQIKWGQNINLFEVKYLCLHAISIWGKSNDYNENVPFTLVENKDWFNTPSDNWGWPRFVSLSELDEPETGFLVNGVCVVEAEVSVLGISKPL